MATDCMQDTVLRFLTERGGTAKNHELISHFKSILSADPKKKATMKEGLKTAVDNVAFVKVENGTKYVCLKKKYRTLMNQDRVVCSNNETNERCEDARITSECGSPATAEHMSEDALFRIPRGVTANDCKDGSGVESAATSDAKQEIPPGSGFRSDIREVERPELPDGALHEVSKSTTSLLVPERDIYSKMGNSSSCSTMKNVDGTSEDSVQTNAPTNIPKIAVIEASPLPADTDATMFSLPQPGALTDAALDNLNYSQKCSEAVPQNEKRHGKPQDEDNGSFMKEVVRRKSRGSQRSVGSIISDGSDEGHFDTTSMSGSDNTPRGSRKNFIELMMNSSPQVRRSMVLRNSVYLATRHKDSRSDSETGSIVSSNTDEDNTPVSLDPMEHEWMMCASDGQWESLNRLLACEPNLILKKDFVTGFTCLHWAAKLGKHELLALLISFAQQNAVPININARSSAGYTPLHLAAMHNHVEVVKLLVGAYNADVEARDYSGKKACQYLHKSATREICDITGGHEDSDVENVEYGDAGRWRLSKVLQSNLRPLKLLSHSEEEMCDSGTDKLKPLRRKASLSKIKPRLHKLRFRTHIVHSTSFSDRDLGQARPKSPTRARPLSSLFG